MCLFFSLGKRYLNKFKAHVMGSEEDAAEDQNIVAYRVFGGRLGFMSFTNEKYVKECAQNLVKLV